jgi:KaiC/GvpD/RAD55 family RecA-like ATPase
MKLKHTGGIFDASIAGIPAGSLIYFSADPTFSSELILYQLCTARKTFYFVTERNPKRVEAEMKEAGVDLENVELIDLRGEKASKIISTVKHADDSNLVIDTYIPFIGDDSLIKELSNECAEKDILCFLCVPKGVCDEALSNHLAYMCDVFFDLRAERVGEDLIVKFAVPKIRGVPPLMTYIRLKLALSGVEVDASRDIV